ncbi:MAG TPA: hypothetical protein VG759_17295 [Candidatus Angelobacter sp.]|jgi:hypothetical protein|nr:hypothetical protein [Candidatus Angelobacter sp.]
MTNLNGNDPNQTGTVVETEKSTSGAPITAGNVPAGRQHPGSLFASRSKQTVKPVPFDRVVMVAAGALVIALVLFISWSLPHKGKKPATAKTATSAASQDDTQRSFIPITDSARPNGKAKHDEAVREEDIQHTATETASAKSTPPNAKGSLASVPPFDAQQNWQAPPPLQASANANPAAENSEVTRAERDALSKSSLVFVRGAAGPQSAAGSPVQGNSPEEDLGLGLATGTRLKARLAYAASTALKTRVIAVIEYNYERDGEVIIPAGAQVVGNIEQADRSGYLSIRFDSLQMPDGSKTPLNAIATDLDSQVLKGRVEGKNTGKSLLARSLSGIGQGATLLVGRGNLNQPLSEQDLLRERVGENIGLASDQEVTRLALNEHVVVSLSAGTPLYIVLQDSAKQPKPVDAPVRTPQQSGSSNTQELRELLQLQRELNQSAVSATQNN